MSTKALRTAFAELGKLEGNLLSVNDKDVAKYKMFWSEPTYVKGEKREKNLGQWTDGNRMCPTIRLIGMVDTAKSALGEYGNCYYDKNSIPTRDDLYKAKFNVAITYPQVCGGDTDEDLVFMVSNQFYNLQDIQTHAEEKLKADGEPEPKATTDWARFEQSDSGTVGWAHATIGRVYETAVRKVKGSRHDSPLKKNVDPKKVKADIEQDSQSFVQRIARHNLKHNDSLPCFLPNGERIGRTSRDLCRELYDGRWVRLDVELHLWNMQKDEKRVFQLKVVRLEVLPMDVWRSGMSWAPMEASAYGPMDKAAIGADKEDAKASVAAEDKASPGEDTVSEGDSTKITKKRSAEKQLIGPAAKK